MAELIRRQVDELIKAYKTRGRDELREQAKEARGKYGSGRDDVSEAHDSYLGGDFYQRHSAGISSLLAASRSCRNTKNHFQYFSIHVKIQVSILTWM